MTEMVKYHSIENHYNNSFIERIRRDMDENAEWIAREKIHGTNFQVIIPADGSRVEYAKRTSILKDGESFNDYQNVMRKYEDSFKAISKDYAGKEVRIFGELAGKGIQKNTPYGEKDFWVFDIRIDGVPVDDYSVNQFCEINKLRIAPFIKRGKLEELIKLNPEFNSLCNSENQDSYDYDEPEIEFTEPGEGNSEGYVIKPSTPTIISTGGLAVLKIKSQGHREKKNHGKEPRPKAELSEKDNQVIKEITQYITKARVSNVYSHGELILTDKTFGKLGGLVIKDIIEEFGREHDGRNPLREMENSKLVMAAINREVFALIREFYAEIKL